MGAGLRVDVLVVGGGLGGVAAALAASRRGRTVVLTEETDWLGGQLTQQAVPPDEHPWIEQFGCTASYRRLRDGIRDYYRRWYPLTRRAFDAPHLNPGAGTVSALCHEPRVAVAVIDGLLAPHRGAGRLQVLTEHVATDAAAEDDRVTRLVLRDLRTGAETVVEAAYVVDATETGDVLPLAGAEYVTGFESRRETGEPHAPEEAQPANFQAITHCFVLEHRPGEDHTIERPGSYAFWRSHRPGSWPGPLLSLQAPDPKTGRPRTHRFQPNPDEDGAGHDLRSEAGTEELWTFRRIAARRTFVAGAYPSDLTLMNWPMADYTLGTVVDGDEAARHRQGARELALSLLYWLQTETPRDDGGSGHPGLRLRPDVVGTLDGFAKRAYVRESRRIRALRTVVEQDLAADVRGEHGAVRYPDTVGIGCYRIDLHPSTGGDGYIDIPACPFQIPLGALIPRRVRNLLAGAKNVGTTHITNGCYRLHPTEWNIGEVAGCLAAFCLDRRAEPRQVRTDTRLLDDFQDLLAAEGVELAWPRVAAY